MRTAPQPHSPPSHRGSLQFHTKSGLAGFLGELFGKLDFGKPTYVLSILYTITTGNILTMLQKRKYQTVDSK